MRYYIAQPVSLFHSSSCFVSQLPPHTETKKCFLPSFFFFSISLFIYGLWLHGRPKKKPHVCLPYSTGWLCVWYITAAQWYLEERNHQEKSLLVRSQQLHSLLCHRQSLSSSYSRQRNRLFSSLAAILASRVSSYRYKTFPKETPLATAAPAALSRCVVRISAELAYLFLPFLFGICV